MAVYDKAAKNTARRAFQACIQRDGRWREVVAFRRERRAEFNREHPLWNEQKVSDAVWSLAFAAFPPSGRCESPAVDSVARSNELPAGNAQAEQIARSKLLEAALVSSERGGIQDDTEWCYQNLQVPWDQIPLEGVPSPGSVALLTQAKLDKKWFLQTYHAKLLPTKSKVEAEGWFETDDGQIAEMAARIREENAMREVPA